MIQKSLDSQVWSIDQFGPAALGRRVQVNYFPKFICKLVRHRLHLIDGQDLDHVLPIVKIKVVVLQAFGIYSGNYLDQLDYLESSGDGGRGNYLWVDVAEVLQYGEWLELVHIKAARQNIACLIVKLIGFFLNVAESVFDLELHGLVSFEHLLRNFHLFEKAGFAVLELRLEQLLEFTSQFWSILLLDLGPQVIEVTEGWGSFAEHPAVQLSYHLNKVDVRVRFTVKFYEIQLRSQVILLSLMLFILFDSVLKQCLQCDS